MIFKLVCVLYVLVISIKSLAEAQCSNYSPGQPRDGNGVPRCACGYYYVVKDGGPSTCPPNYSGPKCYGSTNAIYNDCGGNPRCCCSSGACCDQYGRYRPSSYVCNSKTGPCDSNVYCTGHNAGCPSQGFLPGGTLCQASRGPCEGNRYCTGNSGSCPTNYKTNLCASSRGPCEADSYCPGNSPNCPTRAIFGPGTLCRASRGPCEDNAYCTTGTPNCPSTYKNGALCRAARGSCETDAYCGSAPQCPSTYLSAGTTCAASQGPCEEDQTCTGSSPSCPRKFRPSSFLCSVSTGPCENDRYCTGSTASCPSRFMATGTICRPSRGPCEVDGKCLGDSSTCPNTFLSSTTICKFSQGPCELNATCSGNSETCSALYRPSSHKCADSRGICESDRYCTGQTPECNLNFKSSTEVCANGTTTCEKSFVNCSGSSHICPSLLQSNGTICGNRRECTDTQLFCNGETNVCLLRPCERCESGFYGQDCSCTTPPPSFLVSPECNQSFWYSRPNFTIINDKVISIDGNIVVIGNFTQTDDGVTIISQGTNITIQGTLTTGGAVIIDVKNPNVLDNGGIISVLLKAGAINGTGFGTVALGNYRPPTCSLLDSKQEIVDLPPSDDPTEPKKGVSLIFSLKPDPQCASDSLIVVASSTSAAVGTFLAGVVFTVYMMRKKKEQALREDTKDRLNKVQRALTEESDPRKTKRFTQIHVPSALANVWFAPPVDESPFAPPSKDRRMTRRATGARPMSHYEDRKSRRARRKAIHESAAPEGGEASHAEGGQSHTTVSFAPPNRPGTLDEEETVTGHHHRRRRHVHSKYNPRFSARYSQAIGPNGNARKSVRKSYRTNDHRITRKTPTEAVTAFAPPSRGSGSKHRKRKAIKSENEDETNLLEPANPVAEASSPMETSFAPPAEPVEPVAAVSASNKKSKRKAIISANQGEEDHMVASFIPPPLEEQNSSFAERQNTKRSKRKAILSESPPPAASDGHDQRNTFEMQVMTASYVAPIQFSSQQKDKGEDGIDYSPYETATTSSKPTKRTQTLRKAPKDVDTVVDYTPFEAPMPTERSRKSSIAANIRPLDASSAGAKRSTGILMESYKPRKDMESSFKPPGAEVAPMEASFKPPTEEFAPPAPKKSKRKAVFVDATRSDK